VKAIVVKRLGGPDVLEWQEVPDPHHRLETSQVLIQVAAASVNYADTKARSGGYHLARRMPFIPGIDVAGTVVAAGSGVRRFRAGIVTGKHFPLWEASRAHRYIESRQNVGKVVLDVGGKTPSAGLP
jgi:NADPH:quinone reductase-like Zn-dependent oxidoreductase